jgi:hypothetical protein
MQDVVIVEFCFSTPLIIMHMCLASIITAAPAALGVIEDAMGDLTSQVFLDL